jgi:hypothetical protein
MHFEGSDGLIDESDAVREKENALGPVAAHQQVAERNDSARFAGAGGHDEESAAVVVLFEGFTDAANGAGLVVTLHNGGANDGVAEGWRVARR